MQVLAAGTAVVASSPADAVVATAVVVAVVVVAVLGGVLVVVAVVSKDPFVHLFLFFKK